jgi:ParB family chromosome partitioning protein
MSIKEKMAARTAAIASPSGNRPVEPLARPKTGPGQFLAAMPILAEKEEELEKANAENASLREQLEQALANGNPLGSAVEVPLDQLHEVPGRRRYMPREKYIELRDNLKTTDLIHAVVVLPRESGGYEIWSGHHRVDAYRELGRTTIMCVMGKAEKASVSAGAFYANLMQSDLTDFEKYQGFKRIQEENPGITQAQMAERAGVATSVLSRLMSFEQLPEPVLQMLNERPALLGATSGSALSGLAAEGKAERVIEAVQKLAKGEIDQTQAVKLASTEPAKPKETKKAERVKVRVGKAVYCSMSTARNVVRMEFQSEEEAAAAREGLTAFLEARAEELRAQAQDEK